MKLLIHQLKTEFYTLRWALLVWAFIFAAISWLELTAWNVDTNPELRQNRPTTPAEVINWFAAISIFLLTLLAQFSDLFADKRAPWITRPMPPLTLYGAKALLVILTAVLPLSLLACVVYSPIAGWKFTGYFIAEIWGWSLAIIALVSLINVQRSWLFNCLIFVPLIIGAIYINTSRDLQYNETVTWWFSYLMILTVVTLGLLYLAIFRRNKAFSLWPALFISAPLIAAHAYPLNLPWYQANYLTELQVDDIVTSVTFEKSAPIDVGSTTGGTFSNGARIPDRISFSYALPMASFSKTTIPQFIKLDDELELTVEGESIDPSLIITGLGLWDSGIGEECAGDTLWQQYTPLRTQSFESKTTYKASVAIPDAQFKQNFSMQQASIASGTQAHLTGSGHLVSYGYLELFRSKFSHPLQSHKEGLSVSWKPTKNGGAFTVKIVNTALRTGSLEKHETQYERGSIEFILVNHERKEWTKAYLHSTKKNTLETTTSPITDTNHIRYTGAIDLAILKERWNQKGYSPNKKAKPDFHSWIEGCELIAYRKVKAKPSKVKVDIKFYLPSRVVEYLKQKGFK